MRIAGFDCHVWYRCPPPYCMICRKIGHRSRACPLDGRCCPYQLPGHFARDCRNAWGSSNPTAPGVLPSTSRPGSGACSQPPNTGPAGADLENAAPVGEPSSEAAPGVDCPVNKKIVVEVGASVPAPASPSRRRRKRAALPSAGAGKGVATVSPSVVSFPPGVTEVVDGAESLRRDPLPPNFSLVFPFLSPPSRPFLFILVNPLPWRPCALVVLPRRLSLGPTTVVVWTLAASRVPSSKIAPLSRVHVFRSSVLARTPATMMKNMTPFWRAPFFMVPVVILSVLAFHPARFQLGNFRGLLSSRVAFIGRTLGLGLCVVSFLCLSGCTLRLGVPSPSYGVGLDVMSRSHCTYPTGREGAACSPKI